MSKKRMNIKVSKKGLAILLSLVLAGGGCAVVHEFMKDKSVKINNEIGYDDFNPFLNFSVDSEDFVVFDVGDHDSPGPMFLSKKLNKCDKKDISCGIEVMSDAKDECDIYNDVDYVKGLVRDYHIDFPIYLNIDDIITNDDLNVEMKSLIIGDFLNKCTSNNIYVGVSGTDTNLCRLMKFFDLGKYDAFLKMDSDVVKYDGNYNVYKDLEGVIHSRVDLADVINSHGFNTKEGFASDLGYVLKDGEDILDVSIKYGISVKELLEFNGIKKKDCVTGTRIRIPSLIDTKKSDFTESINPLVGCDISYAQGYNTNYEKLSENFDFVILKCNEGTDKDSYFDMNYSGCSLNNIPVGAYCYNEYSLINCGDDFDLFKKKLDEQANCCLNTLKNKKMDYPVYLNIEHYPQVDGTYLSPDMVNYMLDNWYSKMSDAGYIPGLYCNQYSFRYIKSCCDSEFLDKFEIWVAGGENYGNGDVTLDQLEPSEALYDDYYGANMVQVTDSCINAGSGNSNGHLDIDYSLVDYTNQNNLNDDDLMSIKKFNKIDYRISLASLGCIGLIGAFGGITYKLAKKKRKRR